jgi:hypothetical protein
MASSTGTEPLTGIMHAKFHSVTNAQVYHQAGRFDVLLFHGSNGMSIMNARAVNHQLKPCEGANNADRRPAGSIMFSKLISNLTFTTAGSANLGIILYTLFVHLPTENRMVQNSTGNNVVELTMFHGPNDWASIPDQAVMDSALQSASAFGEQPFNLEPPAINNINPARHHLDQEQAPLHSHGDIILCIYPPQSVRADLPGR